MNSISQSRNHLIIKGSVPWEDVLRLLDKLLKKVAEISKCGATPLPCQVFSFISVSGDKRYVDLTQFSRRRSHSVVRWLFFLVEDRRV